MNTVGPYPTFRVDWTPGSDELRGRCPCGAGAVARGPADLFDWLDDHRAGHVERATDPGEPTEGQRYDETRGGGAR